MFTDDTIIGSWAQLIERLARRDALRAWTAAEPALGQVDEIHLGFDLLAWAPQDADQVLGALVRLAAADGGDDDDALLLLLHLLAPMVLRLTKELHGIVPGGARSVVGELAVQIRSFPVRDSSPVRYPLHRRTRAWAANMKFEVRRALLAEGRPSRGRALYAEVLVGDCLTSPLVLEAADQLQPGPHDNPEVDVVDLLLWAIRSGVNADDIGLLVAVEVGRDRHRCQADRRTAAAQGVAPRTLYRRRERALTGIRAVRDDYLSAVA